jgi:eIF-2B alpha/beta/delta-like uncharacterized protein
MAIHVWVDETRPRNQGASLTAWELGQQGVAHTVIADNAGGHLMRQGKVDVCIVGADRVAANGDVCNKIGTYLKALAAFDNRIPFYAALPHSTIDWSLPNGDSIQIEERDAGEVHTIAGLGSGQLCLRCHAGETRQWPHHRTRRGGRLPGRTRTPLPLPLTVIRCASTAAGFTKRAPPRTL